MIKSSPPREEGGFMPKTNRAYKSAKRSRELSRQQKKEEKRKKKLEREKSGVEGEAPILTGDDTPVIPPAESD